jgi:hypothetical protein
MKKLVYNELNECNERNEHTECNSTMSVMSIMSAMSTMITMSVMNRMSRMSGSGMSEWVNRCIRPLEISKSFVESFTNLWSFERLQNLQKVTNHHKLS